MSDEPKTLARPCPLCDLPCVRVGEHEPNSLWTDHRGRVMVVHSRCKRRLIASAHAGRERPIKRKPGPQAA